MSALSLLVVGASVILAGRPRTGFDATWALVWGRDAIHLRAAAVPSTALLSTPHPASIGLGAILGLLAPGHAVGAWSTSVAVALVVLFAGVVWAGQQAGNILAGWAAVIILAVQPAVQDAVGRGTIDIAFASCCVWALNVMRNRPVLAGLLAGVACLCRPEGWLVLVLVWWCNWERSARTNAVLLTLVTACPCIWMITGKVMFGDPLATIRITQHNGRTADAASAATTMWHALTTAPGLAFAVVAAAGGVTLIRRHAAAAQRVDADPRSRAVDRYAETALLACGLLGFGLVAEVGGGAQFVTRYLTGALALGLPAAIATLCRSSRDGRFAKAAMGAAVCLSLLAVAVTWHQDKALHRDYATQDSAARSFAAVVNPMTLSVCRGLIMPQSSLLAVAALALPVTGHLEVAQPRSAPQNCVLISSGTDVSDAAGWGPTTGVVPFHRVPDGMQLVTRNTGWALYART